MELTRRIQAVIAPAQRMWFVAALATAAPHNVLSQRAVQCSYVQGTDSTVATDTVAFVFSKVPITVVDTACIIAAGPSGRNELHWGLSGHFRDAWVEMQAVSIAKSIARVGALDSLALQHGGAVPHYEWTIDCQVVPRLKVHWCVLSTGGLNLEVLQDRVAVFVAPGVPIASTSYYRVAVDGVGPVIIRQNATLTGSKADALIKSLRRGASVRVTLADSIAGVLDETRIPLSRFSAAFDLMMQMYGGMRVAKPVHEHSNIDGP